MAWEIQKLHANQSLSIGVEPQEAVLRTQWLIAENDPAYDGTLETSWNVWNSIKSQVAPFDAIKSIGMRMSTVAADGGLAQFIVTDLDVSPHPAKGNCYLVTQTAKGTLLAQSPYRGFKMTTQSSNRVVQQFIRPKDGVTNASPPGSFPVGGNVQWPSATLITNGSITNVMSNPIQFSVSQLVIRIEFLVMEPNVLGYTSFPQDPLANLNKRNSDTFLGAPAGRILFQSYEERYVSDQVKMDTFTFVYDNWYHLDQIPMRNPADGSIWNDASYSLAGTTVKATARAVWFQPYEGTAAFNTPGVVLPTEILDLTANVQPAWA